MDGKAAGAPPDFHFYPLDLYDPEDRLHPFPEGATRTGREVYAEMAEEASDPGSVALGKAPRALEEEVDELVHLYALGGAGEWGSELADGSAPCTEVPEHLPLGAQRDWQRGPEAGERGCVGWGATGPGLRETYRCAHGRAIEEYECYVIPEEEDEDEAALVFCVTCRAPVRALEVSDEHREHEVTALDKALESAKVSSWAPWLCGSGLRTPAGRQGRKGKGLLGREESTNGCLPTSVRQDEVHKNMFKLEKQILEMENFANHLEEVFITVEVRAGVEAVSGAHVPQAAGSAAVTLRVPESAPTSRPVFPGHVGDVPHGAPYLPAFPPEPRTLLYLASAVLSGWALPWPFLDRV